MKRRFLSLFTFVAAWLIAAGCAMDETVEVGSMRGDLVVVAPTTTRAAVTTLPSLQEEGFMAYAVSGDAASTGAWYPGIDGTNPHLFSDGQWNFEVPVPWPGENAKYPMTFYAWYPAYPAGMTSLTAEPYPAMLQGLYTVKTRSSEQEDLVVGNAVASQKPQIGIVSMTFRHVLSKLDIGIVPGKGATAIIQAMGVAYVGDERILDLVSGSWLPAQPASYAALFPYYGTLDFLNGGSATVAPVWGSGTGSGDDTVYRPYTPEDGASLMLMPQTGPSWAPVAGNTPTSDAGLVYVLYNMTNNQPAGYTHEEVGYRSARSHPDYAGGYQGPLYALAGFPLSPDATFTWEPGKGYTYNIALGNIVNGIPSCNGYLLSEYYYDNTGRRTTLRVRNGRRVGEKLNDGVIHVIVDVNEWNDVIDEI